ncbi:MAG TPA: 30S ribosomal protein S27ae [Thermoprotei archaeon]|nr:30S ribosomal protein S27ae [Euryarchaeota archaeon]RLF67694.1 MAG: 30S ribosomal protein S27ae [Thermoplasmata archaeon]HDJ51517.1 30S ribosomal protein S27ae [Thermoprotei archaeon]
MAKGAESIYKYYEIKDGKVIRKRRFCPKCGPGTFLAEHKDRWTCGKCGYTEFKTRKQG